MEFSKFKELTLDIFQKNLEAILANDPQLVSQLISIQKNEKFEVYLDKNDSLNINIVDKINFLPLYKTQPIVEIEERFKKLDSFKRYPYLYFFGLGNGILYKMLLQNSQHQRILVVEPELEILYIVLNLIDFSSDINEKRFFVLYDKNINFATSMKYFTHRNVKIFSKLYNLEINCEYYHKYNREILEVNKKFVDIIHHTVLGAGNDSIDALIGLEHHIMNLPKVLETPSFLELTKKAKVTNCAILVSTGPSLNKQLPLLKEIQNSVVIVSVDASFPVLYKNGVKPDIVVSMERIPLTGEFFKKTPKEAHEGVIFALSSLQHPNVINNIKAGIKQISLRPFGYTRATGPDNWGYVGIGMSAANMAYEIIYHCKFEQCILIGQDLAYADSGHSHADGHLLGANEVKEKPTDSYVTRYGGVGEIRTTYVWNLFRNFFEADIESSKVQMLTINSTEGGARIHGALELPFQEAVLKYIDTNVQKEKIELDFLSVEQLAKEKKEVEEKVKHIQTYAQEKLDEVKELFLDVAKECEFLDKIDIPKQLNEVDFDNLNALNERLEKIKDYFMDQEFVLVFIDAVQAFIVHQEMEIAKIVVRDVKSEEEKKIKMIDWIKIHKFWLFSLAGCMDAVLVAIGRKGSLYRETKNGEVYDYEEKRKVLETQIGNQTKIVL